jgi:hypothetical protein
MSNIVPVKGGIHEQFATAAGHSPASHCSAYAKRHSVASVRVGGLRFPRPHLDIVWKERPAITHMRTSLRKLIQRYAKTTKYGGSPILDFGPIRAKTSGLLCGLPRCNALRADRAKEESVPSVIPGSSANNDRSIMHRAQFHRIDDVKTEIQRDLPHLHSVAMNSRWAVATWAL